MDLAALLSNAGIGFASGVPDSVLGPFLQQLAQQPQITHQTAASEGSAVSLAAGYSLNSGTMACVYMQNSGLPNALNPLMSLFAPEMFDIPLILIVGWRGEPGQPDEPQHRLIGAQTRAMLHMLGVPVLHLGSDTHTSEVQAHLENAARNDTGAAILVSRGALPSTANFAKDQIGLDRTEVLRQILGNLPRDAQVFTGVGYTSREVMALHDQGTAPATTDFPVVGGMGFAAHLALGAALSQPERPVYCLDGDGAFLMHGLGMTVAGQHSCKLRHIVLNNGCHNSVGGFGTCAPRANLANQANAIGYPWAERSTSMDALLDALPQLAASPGPAFLEILTGTETGPDLPRPTETLLEIKTRFLSASQETPDGR